MQPANTFESVKNFLHSSYRLMSEQLNDLGFLPRLIAAEEKLYREHTQLLIVGEFSRGKSTFINAILGWPVLPSKVNPTTATINIIKGGRLPHLKIIYHNGQCRDIALPAEKTNKFLDKYVTTVNDQAKEINKVIITWPSRLEEWNCTIVDTPGVNDLDETREEVTFDYMSKADACVLVLDSQQPLSESERSFLQHKVMSNDINRILFVINRMDEVTSCPEDETSVRLINYVRSLLRAAVKELPSPEIYSVSAKETLKARFKNSSSPWVASFERFEAALLRFIDANASKERLPDHVERALTIACDGLQSLDERLQLLATDDQDLEQLFSQLREREEQLQNQMKSLTAFMELVIPDLSQRIQDTAAASFTRLKEQLQHHINRCQRDEDITELKYQVSEGIRRSLDEIRIVIREFREEINGTLSMRFADLLEEEFFKSTPAGYPLPQEIEYTAFELNRFPQPTTAMCRQVSGSSKSFSIVGFISGALFGSISIVAKLTGSFLLGKSINRSRTIEILREQIEMVIQNAEQHSLEIARYELVPFLNKITERINSRLQFIRLTIKQEKTLLGNKEQNMRNDKELLNIRKQELQLIIQKLIELRGALR